MVELRETSERLRESLFIGFFQLFLVGVLAEVSMRSSASSIVGITELAENPLEGAWARLIIFTVVESSQMRVTSGRRSLEDPESELYTQID